MYRVLGADGKEYGPVNGEVLRQWITEGRAHAQTRVQAEGSAEWQALARAGAYHQPVTLNLYLVTFAHLAGKYIR